MNVKKVAKSIDTLIGSLEDIKSAILEDADEETTSVAKKTKTPAKKVEEKTSSKKSVSKVEKDEEEDEVDYDSMKYNDLKKLAVEQGLKKPNIPKDELIAFLSGKEAPSDDEDEDAEDVDSEDVENETDEEDVTAKVNELLADVETTDIATFLTDNGISAKGKRPALIAKVVTAIEDGDISIDDLVVEDEEDEVEEKKPTKKSAKAKEDKKPVAEEKKPTKKPSKKAPEPEPKDDDEGGYEEDEDGNLIDESEDNPLLSKITSDRFSAFEKTKVKIEKDLKTKRITTKEMKAEVAEFFTDDDGIDITGATKEELLEVYALKYLLLTDDEGELHEAGDPYEVNELSVCCGHVLVETSDGLMCEVCGEEYETE